MSKFNKNAVLFNLGGASILVFVAGYMATSFIATHTVEQCSLRFPAGVQFALDGANGAPLSSIEMQAQAGMRAWGMLENAKVIQSDDAVAPKRLAVTLAPTSSGESETENGMGFVWPVSSLQAANSACLSYSVMLPADASLNAPARLPGIAGFDEDADPDAQMMMAHMGWSSTGEVGVEIRAPASNEGWIGAKKKTNWPLGRWVRVDQEVVLNTPGKSNGVVRVWVDGELRLENESLNMRPSTEMKLSGVVADTGYVRKQGEPTTVSMTPFVVQWK